LRLSISLLLLPVLLAACNADEPSPRVARPAAERLSVVDEEAAAARLLLERVSPARVAAAFQRLEARPYEVDVLYREVDEAGAVARRRSRAVSRYPDMARNPDETLLGEVLAGQDGSLALLRHIDPIPILLPDRPAYLKPEGADYTFRLLPDHIVDGRRVFGAEALRRAGVDEPIRLVRAWEDALTGAPVALEMLRQSSSMLLAEDMRLFVMLETDEAGDALPATARIDATIRLLAERPRRFRVDMALQRGAAPA
jgi:hypothetical protein